MRIRTAIAATLWKWPTDQEGPERLQQENVSRANVGEVGRKAE